MLLLEPNMSARDGLRDDVDPSLRYRLPVGLRPALGPDGTPQAVLARMPDGGLMQLCLETTWPTLGDHERRVLPTEGRFRLQWHGPATASEGEWHDAVVTGEILVDRAIALTPAEAAIARSLVPGGAELLEVEVELVIEGRMPRIPWSVRADGPRLQSQVLALLGSGPSAWADVEDAFAGLSTSTFQWFPLEPAAIPPAPDEALRALARHAAPLLLVRADDRYVAAPHVPERLELSLAVACAGTRRIGLRWSFSEFLAAQPDPSRHLVELRAPAPFEAAIIELVNDVSLAEGGIRRLEVEVETGGPSGRLSHVFEPGQPSAVRLTAIRRGAEPLVPRWRARAIVVTGGRPMHVQTNEHVGTQSIRIDARTLGLVPLRLVAEPTIFEHVSAVELTLGAGTFTLRADAAEAWVVGRRPPATATATAVLEDGRRAPLGELPLGTRGLTVGLVELGVGAPATVSVRPPADLATRAAYLAIQIDEGPWRTLEPGGALAWSVRRPTRAHAPRLRYRTRHVPRHADGRTERIVESAWRDAQGEVVEVEL